jgi:hypothetical protein
MGRAEKPGMARIISPAASQRELPRLGVGGPLPQGLTGSNTEQQQSKPEGRPLKVLADGVVPQSLLPTGFNTTMGPPNVSEMAGLFSHRQVLLNA